MGGDDGGLAGGVADDLHLQHHLQVPGLPFGRDFFEDGVQLGRIGEHSPGGGIADAAEEDVVVAGGAIVFGGGAPLGGAGGVDDGVLAIGAAAELEAPALAHLDGPAIRHGADEQSARLAEVGEGQAVGPADAHTLAVAGEHGGDFGGHDHVAEADVLVADGDEIAAVELVRGDVDGALLRCGLRTEPFVGQPVGTGGGVVDDGVADADDERILGGEDGRPELIERRCGADASAPVGRRGWRGRGWRHGGRIAELGDVGAGGQVDDHGCAARLRRGVVLDEAFADFAGADADDGVVAPVRGGRAAEDIHCEGALFERADVVDEGAESDAFQEPTGAFAALEGGAGTDPLEFRHHLIGGGAS